MIPRASLALAVLLAARLAPAVSAQEAVKKAAPPVPLEVHDLTVSPSTAPTPALKYALIPSSARRTLGDGSPILLRLRYGVTDQEWAEIEERGMAWADLPADAPWPAEAAGLVEKYRKPLDLLAVGVRRESCDWGYPIHEQGVGVIDLAMPDLVPMRSWGRLQAVEARVAIARGDFAGAARSLATGLALGARIAEGPFLINGLIGVSVDATQLGAVEAWIAAPGSPNLYWALTDLGRPLVDFGRSIEQERMLIERSIPELADVPEPTTPEGWSARLAAIHGRMLSFAARMFPSGEGKLNERDARLKAALGPDLAEYKRTHLEELRRRLVEAGDFPADRVRAMPDDEAAVRGLVLAYRTVWDDIFRGRNLSFNEAEARESSRQAEWAAAKSGPVALVAAFAPALESCRVATSRLDRRVAMLRVVEAVRMHAAAHGGRLPASLAEVREAPVPVDPSTGRPFGWTVDGDVATLSAPDPRKFTLDYRITIRRP